jgi:hypothetical protein
VFVRSSLLVALLCAPAFANVPTDIPGSGGDPVIAYTASPAIVQAPLLSWIAIRGEDPADTKVMFDEFELPALFHKNARRSMVIAEGISDITTERNGVDLGGGTSFMSLTSAERSPRIVQSTDRDLTVAVPPQRLGIPINDALRVGSVTFETVYVDGIGRYQRRSGRWEHMASLFASVEEGQLVERLVLRETYRHGRWKARAALSPMSFNFFDRPNHGYDAVDGRADVSYDGRAAGLQGVECRAGIDSKNSYHHGFDTWTNDLAAWSSVDARLSSTISAEAGVRIDAFLRGNDYATEPRGSLTAIFGPTSVKLAAAAYRRPPEQYFELGDPSLHPERSKEITATVDHVHTLRDGNILGGMLRGYYIDRTHLITTDAFGQLGNTGRGTSKGIEALAFAIHGRWNALATASLASSRVQDYPRAAAHPATYDQPVRLDAIVRYKAPRWSVGARFSLSSGLPYTPVIESTYISDSDSYAPVFGFKNDGRLPWMHRLDIRAEHKLHRNMLVFIDLMNAYAANTAFGYTYSYDYKTRLATTLPIFPFVGLRGEL